MKLRVANRAAQDLRDVSDYIAQNDPVAAVNFVQKVTERFHLLQMSPGIGRNRPEIADSMRSSSVGDYLVLYRSFTGGIEIVRVVHAKRDLGKLSISG